MEEYGIDLGSKYTVLEQWRRDQLIGNADGAASRCTTDDRMTNSK